MCLLNGLLQGSNDLDKTSRIFALPSIAIDTGMLQSESFASAGNYCVAPAMTRSLPIGP